MAQKLTPLQMLAAVLAQMAEKKNPPAPVDRDPADQQTIYVAPGS